MKLSDLGLGLQNRNAVPEYEAEGEIERVYHEVKQSLRVTGVNLVFRTWAAYGPFLPMVWDELRPNVETDAFDRASEALRDEAVQLAGTLRQPEQVLAGALGPSRAYQIRAALELYHDINPKLLVLVSAVRQALQGESVVRLAGTTAKRAPRGAPAKMYPMEMEAEPPDDRTIRRLFKEIQKTLSLPSVNSDYRTLALWPDYLESAWQQLKPVCQSPEYQHAAEQLRERARLLARDLPYPLALSLGRVQELGEDPDQLLRVTREFEQLLPGLVLNIALLHHDGNEPQVPESAPDQFAAEPVPVSEPAWRAFQKRQQVMELGDRFISYTEEGEGEPVVLLHGIPTWGFLWEKTIAALAPHFRVLAPDLLGYGYSAKRDDFDRSLARQTEAVHEWLSSLNLGAVHLVGHDLGGGIALRLATLFPQRVRSLCLLNSVCYDAWPVEIMLQLGHPAAARGLAPAKTLKQLSKDLLPGFQQPPEAGWLEGLLSPWRTEVGRLSLVRNATALNTNHTTEITRLLPAINVPTLVLWGENDSLLPVKYAERLARDIPGASLVRMAAARHFVMVDQPDRVHRALQEFLERQAAQETRAAA